MSVQLDEENDGEPLAATLLVAAQRAEFNAATEST